MGVVGDREYVPLAEFDDPDDYRPDSELATVEIRGIEPGVYTTP